MSGAPQAHAHLPPFFLQRKRVISSEARNLYCYRHWETYKNTTEVQLTYFQYFINSFEENLKCGYAKKNLMIVMIHLC